MVSTRATATTRPPPAAARPGSATTPSPCGVTDEGDDDDEGDWLGKDGKDSKMPLRGVEELLGLLGHWCNVALMCLPSLLHHYGGEIAI